MTNQPDTIDPPASPSSEAAPAAAAPAATSQRPRSVESGRVKLLPPLSPLTYYRRNVWRTLPVGGAIVISVFLIAAIVTLLNSVDASITTNYGFVRRFSVLTTQLEKNVPPRVLAAARRDPRVKRVISAVPYFLPLHTVFGELPIPVYGTDQKDMQALAEVTGNRLVKGAWPRPNEPEIVLTRTWANNFGKDVGQFWVPPSNNRFPTIPDKQKIVGILEGGENIAMTDKDYLLLELPDPVVRTSHLMVPKSRREMTALNNSLRDLIDNPKAHGFAKNEVRFVKLYTFDDSIKELRDSLGFLYKFLTMADALVISAVAMLSGFLANIYFEQRLGEFGLLSAFGFRRERLARRVMIETGVLVALGWVLGLALTWILFRALDVFYMQPRGLILAPIDRLAIIYTMPTPILVALASLGTVLLRLYRLDAIEIMERR